MRNFSLTSFSLSVLLSMAAGSAFAQTGVGLGTLTPDASAALDVSSSSKGVLFPRVALTSSSDASTVATPATGLVVYNTNATVGNAAQLVTNIGTSTAPVWSPFGAANYWSLTGNANLANTQFLGSRDSAAVSIRTNNKLVAQFQPGGALWLGNTATRNQFIGYSAGYSTRPTQQYFFDILIGSSPAGTNNLFSGYYAGFGNTSGSNNLFMGYQVGYGNTTGSDNLLLGTQAGYAANGNNNQAIGTQAGYSATGSFNQFFGVQTGYSATGSNNQFVGYQAGYKTTSGFNNQFLGYQAGYSNTVAAQNQFLGYQAGYSNTNGGSNQFMGFQAGYLNTTGYNNQFLGYQAGYSTSSGSSNDFVGAAAGYSNTTGSDNLAFGAGAGYFTTTGGQNVFVGSQAGSHNVVGTNNTYVGYRVAGQATGSNNVFLGSLAGSTSQQGDNNVVIGANSDTDPGYSNNTIIGSGARTVLGRSINNSTAIGYMAAVSVPNALVLGGTGANAVKVGIGVTAPTEVLQVQGNILASGTITQNSDRRLKTNIRPLTGALASIDHLRGVRYEFLPTKGPVGEQVGVIAQEVETVYPELVRTDPTTGLKSVNYAQLTPVLLEAIKELRDQLSAGTQRELRIEQAQLRASASLEELRAELHRLESGQPSLAHTR